jgi:transcriptional regulatory protein LevR
LGVPDDHDLSRRLLRLQSYVADKPRQADPTSTNSSDLADWHMRSVMLDRIAHLTMELQRRGDAAIDAVDALEIRLLLNDYTASTTHLRAVTRIAKQGIATASSQLSGARTIIERELQREEREEESGRSSGDS